MSLLPMEFVTPLINTVYSLFNSIATRLSYVVDLDQRARSLTTALKELKDIRDDLKTKVYRAELEGLTCTSQVRGWLERVEAIEEQEGLILDELRQGKQCFWCCNANCSSRYKLSEKISKQLGDISELKEKGDSVVVVAGGSLPPAVLEIPNKPAIGHNVMLEKVQQILSEDEVGIIGIYGMGGVGKTTLLKSINNEFLTKTHDFDAVIWVLVSKDFVAEKIQQAVGERLGLLWEEEITESQDKRALKMYRIMRRKKFLLLLDDVWEAFDLIKIGIPLPDKNNKCKVMFTTRSMDVCSDMDAHRKLKLEFLNDEESWQLFSEKVDGMEILNSPSIRPHAKTIIKKCGGLPLALITVGRAMANKETEEEWKNAIEVLNRFPSELRGMVDVFTLLKFSYGNLDNDTLRSCFLYCSLFPEDYSIPKELLIEYWVGEGFLDSSDDSNVHDKGYALIGSLKVACLLETGEEKTQVKMHDVVRNFALWVASEGGENEKFPVRASEGLIEAPRIEKWEGAGRISLMDNGITELSEIPVCPNLSTLLLQENSGLNRIPNGFFQYMPALQVLDLSSTSLREIPASISGLAELRHLDLSGTKVTTLPIELGGLQKLRHLDLQRTLSLRMIPREAISGLFQLRILNLYYSYGGWELQDSKGENEVRFADLECLRHLTAIGITVTKFTTLEKLSGYKTLLECIQYLYVKECEGLVYLHLSSTSSDGERLRRLSVNNCYDLKYLEIGEGAGRRWLPNLEVLALHGLPNLIKVWRGECLHNLRTINIWHCHKLKNVSWVSKLPRLEILYLFYCEEMEEVVSGDVVVEEDSTAFPSLRTLSIRDLPELQSISQWALAFSSLERIAVINCPKLKKLPLKAHNVSMLPTVYGKKEWWDGLEWDDADTKSALLPHFTAT